MKPFKTLEEQIEILKSRNLKFEDEEKAKFYLLHNNYYNIINCYSKFFINPETNCYYENIYFEKILEIYHFDKEIKQIVLKHILDVERHFKSILAYNYAKFFKNEQYPYFDIKNYNTNNYDIKNIIKIINTISTLAKEIKAKNTTNNKENNSIKHHIHIHNTVPIWVLIDYLSFGEMNHFYRLNAEKVKNMVVKDLVYFLEENTMEKLKHEIPYKTVDLVLENILDLRNITAHNNVLFNFKFRNDLPYLDILHDKLGIKREDNRQSFYHTILYFQMFLSKNEYDQLKSGIKKRIRKLKRKIGDEFFYKIVASLKIDEKILEIILKEIPIKQ
ncbi:Abi family protein [uncultured Fusobacterium sp.]|uniref:Abi family protein n=1 Tax=uncultured Fusobacterium sp. TaxID=159267 RepID=UPI0025DCF370|nr:Abi family protein [uncultured Fusobacterium sp.]